MKGEGPVNVNMIAVIAATEVDKHQIALFYLTTCRRTVMCSRSWPAADHGANAGIAAASLHHGSHDNALDFRLPDAGADGILCGSHGQISNFGSLANMQDFEIGLNKTQLLDQCPVILNRCAAFTERARQRLNDRRMGRITPHFQSNASTT